MPKDKKKQGAQTPSQRSKTTPKTQVTKRAATTQAQPGSVRKPNRGRERASRRRDYEVRESDKGGLSISRIRDRVRKVHEDNDVHPGCDVHKAGLLPLPAVKYLSTVADPTLEDSQMAPLPAANQVPGPVSLLRYVTRGTISCSPNSSFGLAFLSINPGCCLGYTNRPIAVGTNSSFTGSAFDYTQVASQYTDFAINSPFFASELTADEYSARTVACKVDFKNVTAQMARGGILYMLEPQAHDAQAIWGLGPEGLASNPRMTQYNMGTADTMSLLWHPSTDAGQSGYDQGNDPVDQAKEGFVFCSFPTAAGERTITCSGELIVMAQFPPSVLAPGSIQTQELEFEITVIYEAAGSSVPGKTDYVRDADGWSYAASALNEAKAKSGAIDPQSRSPLSLVKDYVRMAVDAAEEAIPVAQNLYSLLG